MATIKKKVCDRCGEEMVYKGWTAKIKGIKKTGKEINILRLYCGNPSGYDYIESGAELCVDCTKKLDVFLSGQAVE